MQYNDFWVIGSVKERKGVSGQVLWKAGSIPAHWAVCYDTAFPNRHPWGGAVLIQIPLQVMWFMVLGWRNGNGGLSAMRPEVTQLPRSFSARLVVLVASVAPGTHVEGTLRIMLGGRQIFSIFKLLYFLSFVREKKNKFN